VRADGIGVRFDVHTPDFVYVPPDLSHKGVAGDPRKILLSGLTLFSSLASSPPNIVAKVWLNDDAPVISRAVYFAHD
jgi:hypothetical protein